MGEGSSRRRAWRDSLTFQYALPTQDAQAWACQAGNALELTLRGDDGREVDAAVM